MKYSARQWHYAEYLLRRIGFQNSKDIEQYLQQLLLTKGRYFLKPKANSGWKFSAKACLEELIKEHDFKKSHLKLEVKPTNLKGFTPSQLAQFSFCPAAFSIASSFESLIKNPSDLILLGDQLHHTLRLAQQKENFGNLKDPFFRRAWQNPAITKIFKSEVVYLGHTDNAVLFQNPETGFSGCPDYLFRDVKGSYFVVEEKFMQYRDPMNPSGAQICKEEWAGTLDEKNAERRQKWERIPFYFFKNHCLQVLTYLVNIREYPLEYGYLVYWLYDFKNGEPYVHKVGVKKLSLDPESLEFYRNFLSQFNEFKRKTVMAFDVEKVNVKKCAACAQNLVCMHKTKRFDQVHHPYQSGLLQLFPAQFPSELKHHL